MTPTVRAAVVLLVCAAFLAGCGDDASVRLRVTDVVEGPSQIPYGSGTMRCDGGFTQLEVYVTNRLDRPLPIVADHWRLNLDGASRQPSDVDAAGSEVAPGASLPVTLYVCDREDHGVSEVLLYSMDPMEHHNARLMARAPT